MHVPDLTCVCAWFVQVPHQPDVPDPAPRPQAIRLGDRVLPHRRPPRQHRYHSHTREATEGMQSPSNRGEADVVDKASAVLVSRAPGLNCASCSCWCLAVEAAAMSMDPDSDQVRHPALH